LNHVPVIADVVYTASDETYYVGNSRSQWNDTYRASTLTDLDELLVHDGWSSIGRLARHSSYISETLPVPAWQRGPHIIAAWLEIEGLFDSYRLKDFAAMSRHNLLWRIAGVFHPSETKWRGNMMRLPARIWFQVAAELTDDDIRHLVRFFTIAERDLPEWAAGSVSPVVWLVRALAERGNHLTPDEVAWITSHSSNPYLPYGTLR
jgi:hypothetical protein